LSSGYCGKDSGIKAIIETISSADFAAKSKTVTLVRMEDTQTIEWKDFEKIDLRVGTIVEAEIFKEAKKPAYKLMIDFGEAGLRKSSAQITVLYEPEQLIGKQVIAVVNFPPKQIANVISECLVLGAVDGAAVTLLTADLPTANGLRIG